MSFSVLLYGEAGVGKTTSLSTLVDAGYKVRLLAAENNAVTGAIIAKQFYKKRTGKELTTDQFALMIPSRPKRSLEDLIKAQENFISKTLESQFKIADPKRKNYTRYLEVLKSLVHFIDSETGIDFGSMDDWGEDTVFCVDSLTIICEAIMASTVGGKLAISQPEWGLMQKALLEFLRQLTEDTDCNFVLLGHPTKEIDQVLGVQRIYPASLGVALNSKMSTIFTEVIYVTREKGKFFWSTDHRLATTRTTLLPIKDHMEQSFKLLQRA